MKRIVRLTERDLTRIVRRVIREQEVGVAVQPDPTDGEWERIRDWFIENMNGEEVPLGDTERYVVYMKAGPNRPRPYYIINYDGKVRLIYKTPMDAASIMDMINNKSDELTRLSIMSNTNFNDFIKSMKNSFENSPYLQKTYPEVAKELMG